MDVKIYRVVPCLSAYSVPENTNQRESAEFAGVIRASFMGALFVVVLVNVPVIVVCVWC